MSVLIAVCCTFTEMSDDATGSQPVQAAGDIGDRIEQTVAPSPVNASIRTALLALAGASVIGSLVLQTSGKENKSLFVGQWAPTLVAVALWYQIVKDHELSRRR
jgi:hypothetical protein